MAGVTSMAPDPEPDAAMSSDQRPDSDRKRTTEPTHVRSIVESRGGYPAHEAGTEGRGDHGLLRIGRHGADEDLKEITWETFAAEFEEKDREFVYPEEPEPDEVGTLRQRSDR